MRLVLAGPPHNQPCGIVDYVEALAPYLARLGDFRQCDYTGALEGPKGDEALLLHYERSRVPHAHFLKKVALLWEKRFFLVPHEVYEADPFAFPFTELRARYGLLLWAKQWLYRWRHRRYEEELKYQARGYGASAVFPLTGPALGVLRHRNPDTDLELIPHAIFPKPPEVMPAPLHWEKTPRWVWGVFGFLTAANDYAGLFEALAELPDHALLLIGGERVTRGLTQSLKESAQSWGVLDRVHITGHLPSEQVNAWFAACHGFIAPFRFRSASGSLLRVLALEKTVVANAIPLTEYLKTEGAGLVLKEASGSWVKILHETPAKPALANHYSWSFERVAALYREAMLNRLSKL